MPKELPGFYYDEEKNRYFPTKGPIPGSSRKRKSSVASSSAENAQKSVSEPNQANKSNGSLDKRTDMLLQFRELCGNITPSTKGRLNFRTEFLKKLASQPSIWKYHKTQRIVESGLEHINVRINMPVGPVETDMLVTGGVNGTLCLFEVGKVAQEFDDGVKCMPTRVWPPSTGKLAESAEFPRCLWRPLGASVHMPSDISCIDEVTAGHVLVTTLGSGASGGAVYILDVSEPLDLDHNSNFPIVLHQITSFESTIWAAASNFDGSQVLIGTNRGAALVNIETGTPSQVFRCKSDVLSVELDNSGHIILCGLRSGAIVTVDARQKPREFSSRFRVPHDSHVFPDAKPQKNMYGSCQISMPSSISCLVSLLHYDQYFLASSMDGSMKLYDHRLLQKGAVQSYEGHVNSHTRIQLGVDPAERIVMSGGEDCKMRLWSIRSGEMLFEGQFMNSIPSIVCWPRPEVDSYEDYWHNHSWGVWFGSREGLFYMNWP